MSKSNSTAVVSRGELTKLAKQINAEHVEAEAGLEHARDAGLLLIEAKEKCGHGKWLPWIEENLRFSEHTARCYVLFAQKDELSNRQATADLTLEYGLCVLRTPKEVNVIVEQAYFHMTQLKLLWPQLYKPLDAYRKKRTPLEAAKKAFAKLIAAERRQFDRWRKQEK